MISRSAKLKCMVSVATLGGGCFWCLEAAYQLVGGVEKVVSGYSGGSGEPVNYDTVHTTKTGYAEVIQVTFDPNVITYRDILEIFFTLHDPTTLNRQGNDVGEEYRSIVLYHDDNQRSVAEDMITNFAPTLWDSPIVTELKPFVKFYPAEDYHQNFYQNNQNVGYCQVIINPKLAKLREKFSGKLKST
jgi:peptide-methionine (S)-S-oxide reductase